MVREWKYSNDIWMYLFPIPWNFLSLFCERVVEKDEKKIVFTEYISALKNLT